MTALSFLDLPRRDADEVDKDEDGLERTKSFLGWIGAFLVMPRDAVCLVAVAVREAEGLGAERGAWVPWMVVKEGACALREGSVRFAGLHKEARLLAGAVGFFWERRDRDREVSNGEFRKSNPGELLSRPC